MVFGDPTPTLLFTLLNEMDGLGEDPNVAFLLATNGGDPLIACSRVPLRSP